MREIVLFVEDYAHQQIIGALVRRISVECDIAIRLDWRVARADRSFRRFVADLRNTFQGWQP